MLIIFSARDYVMFWMLICICSTLMCRHSGIFVVIW